MPKQTLRIVIWGSVAVAAAAVFYHNYATRKVNQLINEADVLIEEGDAKEHELGQEVPEVVQFLFGAVPREYVSDRAKLETPTAKANEILTRVVEDYGAAAAKFEAGRRIGWTALMSTRYLGLMSQAYQNARTGRRPAARQSPFWSTSRSDRKTNFETAQCLAQGGFQAGE